MVTNVRVILRAIDVVVAIADEKYMFFLHWNDVVQWLKIVLQQSAGLKKDAFA